MNRTKAPWPIKYTIAINILSAVCLVICALMAAFLGFFQYYPKLYLKAEAMGVHLDSSRFTLLFVASVIMWLLPVPLLLYCNRGISNQKAGIRFMQILLSLVFLAYFPLGTVLYGIVICCFLADRRTKAYLKGNPPND